MIMQQFIDINTQILTIHEFKDLIFKQIRVRITTAMQMISKSLISRLWPSIASIFLFFLNLLSIGKKIN